jgi:hypothetical protein
MVKSSKSIAIPRVANVPAFLPGVIVFRPAGALFWRWRGGLDCPVEGRGGLDSPEEGKDQEGTTQSDRPWCELVSGCARGERW